MIFAVFAVAHLLRLITRTKVSVGMLTIPMGVSWIALILAVFLCVWFWRLASH
jgi:hypothetical protein